MTQGRESMSVRRSGSEGEGREGKEERGGESGVLALEP